MEQEIADEELTEEEIEERKNKAMTEFLEEFNANNEEVDVIVIKINTNYTTLI